MKNGTRDIQPPVIDSRLVDYLLATFPPKVRSLETPVSRLYADIGVQEVVSHIRNLYLTQQRDEEDQNVLR